MDQNTVKKALLSLGMFIVLALPSSVSAASFNFCPGAPYPFPWCYQRSPFDRSPVPTPTIVSPAPSSIPTPTIGISPSAIPSITPTPTAGVSGVLKGAYVGDGIENLTNVTAFQNLTGKKLDTILIYEAWEGDWKSFRPQWISNAYANGSIPMITWEPWNYSNGVNQPNYSLSKIAGGSFDAFITQYAKDAKATGKVFYLRPMHEMNGNWYPWSEQVNGNKPGDYVKSWKHIVDIFRAQGADNVKFVWCPNVNYSGSASLSSLFPGDNYVDYVCMDGYNWGDINGGFQSFSKIFQPTYDQIIKLSSKPVIIGEMASAEIGGSKASWITDAYSKLKSPSFDKVVLVNWFNANKEKDWRVNSSASSLSSFKNAIK